ncbi:MAG: hypothetical protein MJ252_24060, partial [archaeon]|nr:hypothetical protein [archaeon]
MNISKDLDVFHDNMSSFSGVSSISQITNKDNCDEANQEEREEDLQFFHCFQRSLVPSDFKIKPKILTQIKAPIKTKQRKITLALSPRNKNNENKMNVIKSRTYATTIKKSETMKKPLSTKTKTPFLDTIKFNLAKTIQNKPYPHKTQSKEIFKVNTTTVNTLVKSSSTMNFLSHKKRTPSYTVNPKYIKEKLENKISEAQSKYMRSLDELYKTKLLKVN